MQMLSENFKGFGKGKAKSVIIICLALVFVLLLSSYTTRNLSEITPVRIADCESRIEALNEELKVVETEEDEKAIEAKIAKYEGRKEMLETREKCYGMAMILIAAVLLIGLGYHLIAKVYFAAPLSALCILLAIGASFRAIISFEMSDVVFLGLSIVAAIVTYAASRGILDMNNWMFYALGGAVVALLFLNVVFGEVINGAKNWVSLFGLRFQPGEIIKFLLIMMGAHSYSSQKRIMIYFATSIVVCGTFLFLRDMGTAVIVFALALMMTVLLLDNPKLFACCILIAVGGLVLAFTMFEYVRQRFMNLGNAMDNPTGQQAQLISSLVFGGLGGLGFEKSSHIINIYSINSDMVIGGITSIFGVGMLLIVMLCYAVLVMLPRKNTAIYPWAYYATTQYSVVVVIQVLLNFLGSVDVFPFTGVVAPYLSDGGSASVTFCMLFGLVAASLNPKVVPLKEESCQKC